MNWDAANAIAEIVGAAAVVITLIYLALQVRYLKRQTALASFLHIDESINSFDDAIAQSPDLAAIIVRGQQALSSLAPHERLRFDHVFARLLNIIESWHFLIVESAAPGRFRDEQIRNLREFIRARCRYPGVVEFWSHYRQCYDAATQRMFEENVDIAAPANALPES